jgi:hypothetical protein
VLSQSNDILLYVMITCVEACFDSVESKTGTDDAGIVDTGTDRKTNRDVDDAGA